MQRRRFLKTASTLSLGGILGRLAAASPVAAAQGITMLRESVGFFQDRGGTIGFYQPSSTAGGVVIDTQFPDTAAVFLDKAFRAEEQLDLLINTHHHGDHTGGNGIVAPLAKEYVSHERARTNLETAEAGRTEGEPVPLPRTTFEKEWQLSLPNGRESVTARHFGPAHTGGDAVIHFENANVAHLGDLLFNRRFPYIDPAAGGNFSSWIDVLKKIRKAYDRDTVFIFGHAADSYPVTGDRDDVVAFRNYLLSLRKYVKQEKRKGTSLDDLKAKTTTIPNAPDWRYGDRLRDVNLEVMWEEV